MQQRHPVYQNPATNAVQMSPDTDIKKTFEFKCLQSVNFVHMDTNIMDVCRA